MKKILYFIIALFAIIACEKRNDNILSAGKMTDVLYDYHLAQGMIESLNPDDREKMAQAYIDAVYKKHNITEAEFDSSLLWYNRNTKELKKIYETLQERFTENNQQIALQSGSNEMLTINSANGDTTNIWNASEMVVLRSKPGVNFETFSFSADTSYYKKDRFILVCNPIFLRENQGENDCYVNIGLTLKYKDGKTAGTTLRCSSTRDAQLTLNANEDKDIESVSGFFYYNSKSSSRNLAIISGIGLIRMHTSPEPERLDTAIVKTDTLAADTTKNNDSKKHHSTEQLKENHTEKRIEIKAAPDVRTPNSFGIRRRHAKPARK